MTMYADLDIKYFGDDWERIFRRVPPEDMLRYRRSLAQESPHVKSFGEKVIANFLFEHDEYRYGRDFWEAELPS